VTLNTITLTLTLIKKRLVFIFRFVLLNPCNMLKNLYDLTPMILKK
jgi:hypothetical protein